LEEQLAGLEALVKQKGEIDIVVPRMEQDEHPRPIRSNPPTSQTSSSSSKTAPSTVASSVNATIPKDCPVPSPLTLSTIGGATATATKAVTTDSIPSSSHGMAAGVPVEDEKSKFVISESVPTAVPQTNT
jgi:hypothetical protein